MSKLKAFNSERIYWAVEQVEREPGDIDNIHLDDSLFYLKSEADKVIVGLEESHKKEVGQLLIKIAEQKSEIERLEILCANYIHDCDNLAISNEQVKRAARTLLKKMNHHKHKRFLAMAKWCSDVRELMHKLPLTDVDADRIRMKQCKWCRKWRERWLAIAEKFKTN
jgi:hypothetical protein